jgi:UDP-glucose 4-epimerase
LRAVAGLTWQLRLQHTDPGWIDLCFGSPVIDCARATGVLGWRPKHTALQALRELLAGIRAGAGIGTPPLAPPGKVRACTLSAVTETE